jgi:hypothetical protein
VVVAIDRSDEPARGDGVVDGLVVKIVRICEWDRRSKLTVYTHTRTSPRNTAKKTQAVHVLVFKPLKKLAVNTAANTIVVESS